MGPACDQVRGTRQCARHYVRVRALTEASRALIAHHVSITSDSCQRGETLARAHAVRPLAPRCCCAATCHGPSSPVPHHKSSMSLRRFRTHPHNIHTSSVPSYCAVRVDGSIEVEDGRISTHGIVQNVQHARNSGIRSSVHCAKHMSAAYALSCERVKNALARRTKAALAGA